MSTPTKAEVAEAASVMGRKGGRNGTGESKARPRSHYVRISGLRIRKAVARQCEAVYSHEFVETENGIHCKYCNTPKPDADAKPA